jgi:23S rRNA (guanine2445-N2)-methyltransferase / 23S rRNA (guanine2069-N7)-methyltransferase
MHLLNFEGLLYFSTNNRHFKLAPELGEKYRVQDITTTTIDQDFKRHSSIHQCYKITKM